MKNESVSYRDLIKNDATNGLNVRDCYQNLTVAQLQEISQKQSLNYAVMCLNVTGDLNVSTMMRTAHLMGASDFFIVGRRRYDKRGTVGAQNYINVHRLDALLDDQVTLDANAIRSIFIEYNLIPIFVEQNGQMLGHCGFAWTDVVSKIYTNNFKPVIVVGNEGRGIPNDVLALKDEFENSCIVSLPQMGVLRSFNVSTALSMVLWDFCQKQFSL